MKILFILKNTYLFERLGVMLLSSLLKRDGHKVSLIVTNEIKDFRVLEKVKTYAPDVIAYSAMIIEIEYFLNLNKFLKSKYDFFSVFGGPYPTLNPDMINFQGVDAICRGEGDIVFPELINCMGKGNDFYSLNNFWFKKDGRIIKNPIGPLVKDLDSLPFADRELMYEADPILRSIGMKSIITMRGCPFQCSYCFNHQYNDLMKNKGSLLRYRSVDNVVQEIKRLKQSFPLKILLIQDDTFPVKPVGWLKQFAERSVEFSGVKVWCNVRAEFINDDVVRSIKEIGCDYVNMGVECSNQEISKNVLKRNINQSRIEYAHDLLKKNKIKVQINNLNGLPVDDPLRVDMETLDFNIKLRPFYAWSSLVFLVPGTTIWDIAKSRKMLNESLTERADSNFYKPYDYLSNSLKRKIVNLQRLFGIIVQFPFLRPITGFLIALPLTSFYTMLFFGLYGYKIMIRNPSFKYRFKLICLGSKFYFKWLKFAIKE